MKSILKKAYRYWMKGVYILGEVNGRIIFTAIFFIVLGAYALSIKFFNIFKKTPTHTSYWIEKQYKEPTIENLTKQF